MALSGAYIFCPDPATIRWKRLLSGSQRLGVRRGQHPSAPIKILHISQGLKSPSIRLPNTMPGLVSQPLEIAQTTTKPLPLAVSTPELLDIADKHITKALGRLRPHVFKEGRGLRILTTVSTSLIARSSVCSLTGEIGRQEIARFLRWNRCHFSRTLSSRCHRSHHRSGSIHHPCPMRYRTL